MTLGDAPLLMTPGPTRIPERVLLAAHRVVHHRTPEFSDRLTELLSLMRPVFGVADSGTNTGTWILPIHATGRAAMEGAIVNFLAPGDAVVACCNGKFGEMWAGFAESYGLRVERVATDWERSVDPAEVNAALTRVPGVRAVTVAHSDTSTGVLNPVREVAAVARAHGALAMVDGISSVGGTPFEFDAWGLDFAVISSQKCLMSSPGIAFAVVGPRAWSAAERSGFPRNYLSFETIRTALSGPRPETPGTTPVSLVFQVLEALRMMQEEGLSAVLRRHREMADVVRVEAGRLGCELYGGGMAERSPTLTALRLPAGIDPGRVRASMRARGIQIAGGLGGSSGDCVRIGHMGDIRMTDVERTMRAFAAVVGAGGG